ncbi:coiled-coil domain-containing protein 151 [Nilaparvata lugens]|uniref:coiled-coil domain-containing protein 151 n=1 Tax=Nilaparvata lugens TaxID=108931 RepID=UPI00193D920E|nr:coiled-coil domain-containing protein 151 [Nilaparvata lugens]
MAPPKEEKEIDLAVINKQIVEIKKKIQLSEGRRKAYYEECDAEKKRNVEKIRNLKKSIKELYSELAKPAKFQSDEMILKAGGKFTKETTALRNKDIEEVAELLDYKVIDLQKKLDLINHQAKEYQSEMKKLADKYHKLVMCSVTDPAKKRREPAVRIISTLENQIHRIEMNQMEADHLRKKYRSIRSSLLQDGVKYESMLKKLEDDIMKEENEIMHLQNINKEAVGLRESTKGLLIRQEMVAMNAAKARDRQMQELRCKVEERKLELERLERRIFPTGRTVIHQDSANSTDLNQATADEALSATEQLDKAFATLRDATGVTATEDVLDRFFSQQETRTRLTFLKTSTEEEKKDLEKRRDMMMAELEAYKFAQVKDKEQNEEEVENVKLAIENEIAKKERLDDEAEEKKRTLIEMKCRLHALCLLLQHVNTRPVPPLIESVDGAQEMLTELTGRLETALQRYQEKLTLEEMRKQDEQMQREQELEAIDEIEEVKVQKQKQEEKEVLFGRLIEPAVDRVSEPEDEEEVPSRGYLKRQAQVIVDSKSRRKGFRVQMQRNFGKKM